MRLATLNGLELTTARPLIRSALLIFAASSARHSAGRAGFLFQPWRCSLRWDKKPHSLYLQVSMRNLHGSSTRASSSSFEMCARRYETPWRLNRMPREPTCTQNHITPRAPCSRPHSTAHRGVACSQRVECLLSTSRCMAPLVRRLGVCYSFLSSSRAFGTFGNSTGFVSVT